MRAGWKHSLRIGLGALGILALLGMGDYLRASRAFRREAWPLRPSPAQSWAEVLAHPTALRLTTFDTGTIHGPLSGGVNLHHPSMAGIADRPVDYPVYAHLVEHPTRGAWLIDAGLSRAYQSQPYGDLKGLLVRRLSGPADQAPGQSLAEQLGGRKVEGILLTHSHLDHTGGIPDLPGVPVLAGKGEPHLNSRLLLASDHLRGIGVLHELDPARGRDLGPLAGAMDLFGDGSLWALPMPGHTPGSLAFLLNAQEGPVLLLGDACLRHEGLVRGVGPGWFSLRVGQSQDSLDHVRAFLAAHPSVRVICGHDSLGVVVQPRPNRSGGPGFPESGRCGHPRIPTLATGAFPIPWVWRGGGGISGA